jgi:hypothetical protein
MEVGAGAVESDSVNEILVERDGQRRLVRFWYTTHRRSAIASETGLTLDHLAGRLSMAGRADGALVRISTPIGIGGLEPARERLRVFSQDLVPEIRGRWPASIRASEASVGSGLRLDQAVRRSG